MTDDRWDTSDHTDHNERRRRPSGRLFEPFHDATVAVDGDAARALGELSRERWRRATGEALTVRSPTADNLWPQGLVPLLKDVDVGIARTEPRTGSHPGAREIEEVNLAVIANAKRYIYIENQYFASRCIALAIAERLREKDGPEIVVVNPIRAKGWLEERAMGRARGRVLAHLKIADQHHRFRIYQPVTSTGAPIYVHSKILIADDQVMKIGSSNLNNRSMGLDTECDVVISANENPLREAEVSSSIRQFRDQLLAEHLGVSVLSFAESARQTSFIQAIETHLHLGGRTLLSLDMPVSMSEPEIAASELLDPETPEPIWKVVAHTVLSQWRNREAGRA
jgi:phospholipase D1/2